MLPYRPGARDLSQGKDPAISPRWRRVLAEWMCCQRNRPGPHRAARWPLRGMEAHGNIGPLRIPWPHPGHPPRLAARGPEMGRVGSSSNVVSVGGGFAAGGGAARGREFLPALCRGRESRCRSQYVGGGHMPVQWPPHPAEGAACPVMRRPPRLIRAPPCKAQPGVDQTCLVSVRT